MAYEHGVRVKENPTSVPTPVSNDAGVPVIFGTSPVNLASDPAGAVNKLFLCNTFAEAKSALGYSEDYESYTLCQAMDAFFKAFTVGPVVFCNVLDPNTHKASLTEELTVVDGMATSETAGVLKDTLTVKIKDTDDPEAAWRAAVAGEDYNLSFNDDGFITVAILTTGVKVQLTGYKLNPAGVTAANVIGAYDASTGKETGMELVRQVYPTFGLVPSLLLAPGWSQIPAVGLALASKCVGINGVFTCECVVDLDTTAVKKYTDAPAAKTDSGYLSEHTIVLWPMVKYAGKIMAYSALYAAMATATDANNDNVPSLSPSNRALRASATVLKDGTEVFLDASQANELNAKGIVTAINANGFKAWGNNTAAYPDTIDPKDRWIACRRFFSWWGNSFIITYFRKVDNPANYRLIESIVDSENIRGNAMVSTGKCAGIRIEFRQDDNPTANILDGHIVFRQYLAPYTPAEDILNILEFDPSMIEAALFGGE